MSIIEKKRAKLEEELKEIAPQVTYNMRLQYAADNGCGVMTVNRYLNGEAPSLVFGKALLKDMRKLLKSVAA